MKKGQTESYSFLIGILITILLLGGVLYGAYTLFASTDTEESYQDLKKRLGDLSTAPEGTLPFYVGKYHVLIGFDRTAQEFTKGTTLTGISACPDYDLLQVTVPKPASCKDQACLCLCALNIHLLYGSSVDKAACTTASCFTLPGIDTLTGGESCDQPFIPGIKTVADTNEKGIQTLRYKKSGTTLSLDAKAPLTTGQLSKKREDSAAWQGT